MQVRTLYVHRRLASGGSILMTALANPALILPTYYLHAFWSQPKTWLYPVMYSTVLSPAASSSAPPANQLLYLGAAPPLRRVMWTRRDHTIHTEARRFILLVLLSRWKYPGS